MTKYCSLISFKDFALMRNEVRLLFLIYAISFPLIKKAAVLKKKGSLNQRTFCKANQINRQLSPFTKLNITYENFFDLSYQITIAQRYSLWERIYLKLVHKHDVFLTNSQVRESNFSEFSAILWLKMSINDVFCVLK